MNLVTRESWVIFTWTRPPGLCIGAHRLVVVPARPQSPQLSITREEIEYSVEQAFMSSNPIYGIYLAMWPSASYLSSQVPQLLHL